jgi:glycosyltransferase involved in cell wall biosynthesis
MATLLIYIPTYNRYAKLRLCVERILAELDGCEDEVVVHISDNGSTDQTIDYLQGIRHRCVTLSRNEENLGGARNVLKVHQYASLAEYSLVLGDDDYLLRGAVSGLVAALKHNSDVDIFFLNSIAYEESQLPSVLSQLIESKFAAPPAGVLKSKLTENFRCTFRDLINPAVDEVFCGSLMCYAFRSSAIRDVVSHRIQGIEVGGLYSTYPHTLNWIHSLAPSSPAVHLARPFTCNFWHQGAEWGSQAYHRVVTQGLGFVFFEMVRLGFIGPETYDLLLRHYLSIARASLKHLLADVQVREDPVLDPRYLERLVSAIMLHDFNRT